MEKVSLILDIEPFRYQKYISDIAGQDVKPHNGKDSDVITAVRNWLHLEIDPLVIIIPDGEMIYRRYLKFMVALPAFCGKLKWNPKKLEFADYSYAAATWIGLHPI